MNLGIKEILGALSVALNAVNLIFYLLTVLRGRTVPHLFTWIIWTFTNAVIFVAQYWDAAGPGAWATGSLVIGCGAVAIASLFRGERNITRTDWIALACAAGALLIWFLTHNPLGSVIVLTCVDSFGFYPTYRKSFHDPYGENATWTISAAVGYGLSILALVNYSWITLFYPVAMVVLQFGLGVMILWRRWRAKQKV